MGRTIRNETRRLARASCWIAAALLAGGASPALAGHHQWDFSELFSNPSGSVQFIEMFSANNNEAGMNGATITLGASSFTFVGNLPSSATANTWLLVATTGFAALSGAPTPDYVLPDNFLPTAGGTLGYEGAQDTWNYPALPTDGVRSLERDLTDANTKLNGGTVASGNSPTAFPDLAGSVTAGGAAVPSATAWSLTLLVGAILLVASGLLRRPARAA